MRKFNLLMIATMVAFGALFTSCSKDDTDPTVTITLDKSTWIDGTDAAVTGTIVSTNDLETVTLLKSGSTVAGWPLSDFSTGKAIVGKDGSYTVRISDLEEGSYTLRATDEDGVESSVNFSIISKEEATSFSSVSTEAANKSISCYLGQQTAGTSCFANASGNTYTVSGATAYSESIDFIYFNNGGNTYTLYSPYAFNALGTSTAVASWNVKNATKFKDVTGSLNYDSATQAQVISASDEATDTKVANLAKDDVVVFKIANTNSDLANKIGILKVIEVTGGSGSTDYIKVSIRLAK